MHSPAVRGKSLEVPVPGREIPAGRIDVVIEKLAGPNAVIWEIEVLGPGGKR